MTETLKRTRYGAVNYGSQKEVFRKSNKAIRRFERKKTDDSQQKALLIRKRVHVLKIRKMFYEGRDRFGRHYTVDFMVQYWRAHGWSEEDVLDVVFYRTWKWLFPVMGSE